MIRILIFSIFFITTCGCQNSINSSPDDFENMNPILSHFPENYSLIKEDNFDFFSSENWSKGLTHDDDNSIRMLWNRNTGGEHLLNDKYAGYILDENVYISDDGLLYLENRKENVQGTNPVGDFEYSTGWINSLQKINFNGTEKGIYIEIKAKFPKGNKVWPAIWLIDDSENRGWPPEIDIWEYFGRFFDSNRQDLMYMRYIYGLWNDKKNHSVAIENFHEIYNASNEFKIYGFQWTNEIMRWYIDGALVHEKNSGFEIPLSDWPNKKMCLVINNGLMSAVAEEDTIFPNSLIIDYIKIFQKDN